MGKRMLILFEKDVTNLSGPYPFGWWVRSTPQTSRSLDGFLCQNGRSALNCMSTS